MGAGAGPEGGDRFRLSFYTDSGSLFFAPVTAAVTMSVTVGLLSVRARARSSGPARSRTGAAVLGGQEPCARDEGSRTHFGMSP